MWYAAHPVDFRLGFDDLFARVQSRLAAYRVVVPEKRHAAAGKEAGLTNHVEGPPFAVIR